MNSPAHMRIANDNDPPAIAPLGDNIGFRSFVIERQRQFQDLQFQETAASRGIFSKAIASFEIPLTAWFISAAMLLFFAFTTSAFIPQILSAFALIWSSLWLIYVSRDHHKPRWAELATLSAIGGFLALLSGATSLTGHPVSLDFGLLLFGMTTIFVASLLRSPIALTVSICSVLIWIAQILDGGPMGMMFLFALPILLFAQILTAGLLRASGSLFAIVTLGYLWIGTLGIHALENGIISPLYLAAGSFLVATAHYRISKAAEDMRFGDLRAHLGLSWLAGIASLLCLEHFLIFSDHPFWSQALNSNLWINTIWLSVCGGCLALILLSGLLRRRHARMFMSSIVLMTCCAAAIPTSVLYHDQLMVWMTDNSFQPAYSILALILGGIIMASAIFFLLNNIRRSRFTLAAIGLVILFVQVRLLQSAGLYHVDQYVLHAISLVGGLIAITLMGHVNEERRFQSEVRINEAVNA